MKNVQFSQLVNTRIGRAVLIALSQLLSADKTSLLQGRPEDSAVDIRL
jgi:hypothetical protein